MFRIAITLALVSAWFSSLAGAAPHWAIQYQYRQLDSSLTINDISFPSTTRGIVCGYTSDRTGKDHPVVLLTNDAGENWTETPVKETGLSLYFLDDSNGWMVTDKGIWATAESGHSWKKLNAPAGMMRVWFVDKVHGFAAGTEKRAFETTDSGATWKLLPVSKEAQGDPKYTVFGEIAFTGNSGLITGWSVPPGTGVPVGGFRPQIPQLTIILETRDAGRTWTKDESSVFGQVTHLSMAPGGPALSLVEFNNAFEYPSEVYGINLHNGKSVRVFREKDRAITGIKIFGSSMHAIIVGRETAVPYRPTPVPGKLKVLTTDDLFAWKEMPVDYRAVAHAAAIAGPDEQHLWIATDTGMILKLVDD